MLKKTLEGMTLMEKTVCLMSSGEESGGPQSVGDICMNLGVSNSHSRSILARLYKSGKIERIEKGVYRIAGDEREYSPSKPHLNGK